MTGPPRKDCAGTSQSRHRVRMQKVPNPLIPNPVTLDCGQCGQAFICDASSQAARDRTCCACAIPGLDEPPQFSYA